MFIILKKPVTYTINNAQKGKKGKNGRKKMLCERKKYPSVVNVFMYINNG
jgi:hypothetical protein